MLRSLLAAVVLYSAGFVAADDKKDEKKTDEYPKLIVGKWEITKAGADVGPGSTLEFDKDKKVVLVIKEKDKEKATLKGTYKLAGDKLTLTLPGADDLPFDQTLVIKKLTDEAMELEDEKGGIDVLKKVK